MPKRNLDRMRAILMEAESMPLDADDEFETGYVGIQLNMVDGDGYQLYLMRDQGWIEGKHVETGLFRITSLGHDYLSAIRDEGIWQETKTAVAATGGSVTLEIVKALAIGFLKKHVKDKTGVEL